MNIYRFENKKFLVNKKNIIIILISVALVIGNYILITLYDRNKIEIEFYQTKKIDLEEAVASLEETVKNEPEARTALTMTKKEYAIINKQVLAIERDDWQEFLKNQIMYDKLQLSGASSGTVPLNEEEIRDYYKNIETNKYLYEHKLQPELSGINKQGINYVYSFYHMSSPFILTLLLLILLADVINSEKTKGNRDFLNSIPLNKFKILNIKLLTYISWAVCIIILMGLTAFFIALIMRGTGTLNYPIAYQSIVAEKVYVFSISLWIIKYLILSIFLIILIANIISFLSLLIYNELLALLTTVIMLVLPKGLNMYVPIIQSNSNLFPIFYVDFDKVLNGEAALVNHQLTFINGIICLSIYSLVFYSLSLYILSKKKYI